VDPETATQGHRFPQHRPGLPPAPDRQTPSCSASSPACA